MIIFNPSSLRRVAISLYNNKTFYTDNFEYMPFLNAFAGAIPFDTVKKFTPSFDFFNASLQKALHENSITPENYNFGLVKSLSIQGIDFFNPVDTYTWSKYISSPKNNVLRTSGDLSLPVILPYSADSPNSKFLQQIWRLAVFWFVPFFLSADVYPQNIGGPLFVKTFSINAADSVSIDLSFLGGISDLYQPNLYQGKQWIDFKDYYNLDNISPSPLRSVFRVAKNYDCLILLNTTPFNDAQVDTADFYDKYNSPAQSIVIQGNNIYSMKLKVDNEIDLQYTANDGVNKNIVDGARYISLKKRSVTGTIEFIASQNLQKYFGVGVNQSLVLYFGGPFYFPMKNVSFQVFSLDLSADNDSYIHKVEFTALLQTTNEQNYYKQNEFDINFDGLLNPPSGEFYVKPQDKFTRRKDK